MSRRLPLTRIALALGLALCTPAIAQQTPNAEQQRQLDAARAELDKAAERYAELSRQYGTFDAPLRIERRVLRKPVIGVLLAPDDETGVRIAGVTPDSAAAEAGLKSGDRILQVGNIPVNAASGQARVEQTRELLATVNDKTPVALRYERGGKTASVSLTPKVGDRLMVFPEGATFDGNVKVFSDDDGRIEVLADRFRQNELDAKGDVRYLSPAVAPDVRREIIRLNTDCQGKACKLPMLADAFRWNGLNLAEVDAQLGRYFGTSEGVLVLSTGKDLTGLQPGDVIRSIDGKFVANPRDAMAALRKQPAGSTVRVDYLRDRKSASAQVAVPKSLPQVFRLDARAPKPMPARGTLTFVGKDGQVQTIDQGKDGAPALWAPKDSDRVERRRFVMVDKDGKRQEWEGDADDAPPAWVQSLPQDGKRVEKRVQVIVDEDGERKVIDEEQDTSP